MHSSSAKLRSISVCVVFFKSSIGLVDSGAESIAKNEWIECFTRDEKYFIQVVFRLGHTADVFSVLVGYEPQLAQRAPL